MVTKPWKHCSADALLRCAANPWQDCTQFHKTCPKMHQGSNPWCAKSQDFKAVKFDKSKPMQSMNAVISKAIKAELACLKECDASVLEQEETESKHRVRELRRLRNQQKQVEEHNKKEQDRLKLII